MITVESILRATAAANRRAAAAEERCRHLEELLLAEQARADRASVEADALYSMLPEGLRPTT